MIGCICCHGPTDFKGRCYICDSETLKKEFKEALRPKDLPPSHSQTVDSATLVAKFNQNDSMGVLEASAALPPEEIKNLEEDEIKSLGEKIKNLEDLGILRKQNSAALSPCEDAARDQPQESQLPCGCTIEQGDSMNSSVFWNEFNKVVQCHKCGHIYEPVKYPKASGLPECKCIEQGYPEQDCRWHGEEPIFEKARQEEKMAEQLHQWYLEATASLHPESFNPQAQKPYADLTEEQKQIDRYIARQVLNLSEWDLAELAALRQWKKEAMIAAADTHYQEVAKELGLTTGGDYIASAILPGIRKLKVEIAKLKMAKVQARNESVYLSKEQKELCGDWASRHDKAWPTIYAVSCHLNDFAQEVLRLEKEKK